MPIVSPFETYDAAKAKAKLPARPDYAEELDDLLAGDMWRGNKAWIGELPARQDQQEAMARGLVSENVLLELLTRHVAAHLGKEPRWRLTPKDAPKDDAPHEPEPALQVPAPAQAQPAPAVPPQETPAQPVASAPGVVSVIPPLPMTKPPKDARIATAEAALTAHGDKINLLGILQQAATYQATEGRAPLYLIIPPGVLENGQLPRAATLEEALDYIYVDARPPSQAGLYTDPKTRLQMGIMACVEVDEADKPENVVEITYLDPRTKETVLKVFRGNAEPEVFIGDMGGRLWMHDWPTPPLLTKPLVQDQKAINLTLTQTMRNINLAGHRQVDYINARPPGQYVACEADDPYAEAYNGGYHKFVPDATMPSGPGVRSFIDGNDIYNEQNQKIGVTTPNVNVVEPVQVDHFEMTLHIFRYGMHAQAGQSHIFGTEQAQSGVSREQARADFDTRVRPFKTAADHRGRWVNEARLALAALIMGTPGAFDDLRCDYNCILDTGPLSPEEQSQIRENVAAGLVSSETAMSQLGIDDVDSEKAKIDAEKAANMQRAQAAGLVPAKDDPNAKEKQDETAQEPVARAA